MTEPPPDGRDGPRGPEAVAIDIAIRLGFIALFALATLWMVLPFAPLLIWAAILAVATHPVFAWLRARLGGRAIPAAAVLTLVGMVVVFVPAAGLLASLVGSLVNLVAAVKAAVEAGSLALPDWVADLPLVGERLTTALGDLHPDLHGLLRDYGSYLMDAGGWLLGAAGSVIGATLFLGAAILLSGVLLVLGDPALGWLRAFADRVVGARGAEFVAIAGATIQNVARGVIGVALIQSLLTGIGFLVAGVPAAGLITLAALVLSIVQIGAWPVVYPMLVWVWFNLDFWPALLLTLYLLPVGAIDNILKPLVMSQGLNTPILVILFGVIGGTLAYGLVGLFLGPVILALFWELLAMWIRQPGALARNPSEGGGPG